MFSELKQTLRQIWLELLCKFIRRANSHQADFLLQEALKQLHRVGDNFVTAHQRTKSGSDSYYRYTNSISRDTSHPIGIVIQGPLVEDHRFTLESIRYYRNLSPEFKIILSTWNDTPPAALKECESGGAEIITSEKPKFAGRANLNFQAISTTAGLNRARELGCVFAAKTRSDQRFFGLHTLFGIRSMLLGIQNASSPRQKHRIATCSLGTLKFSPFHLSDHFNFGHIDDMLLYWSVADTEYNIPREQIEALNATAKTVAEFAPLSPEKFLTRCYLKSIEYPIENSLNSWWQCLRNHFYIVDWSTLDVYWPKYWPYKEAPDLTLFSQAIATVPCRQSDWLELFFSHPSSWNLPEYLLLLHPMVQSSQQFDSCSGIPVNAARSQE